MSIGKSPSRVIDGPYANWGADDEIGVVSLTNNSILYLGQPLCIDVTQFGPDANVPNNGALLPQCERLVITTSANAGPMFGVITGIPSQFNPQIAANSTLQYSTPNVTGQLGAVIGVPQWKNVSGSTVNVVVQVRQLGWAYVLAGAVSLASSGKSVKVGDNLVTSTSQIFAVSGTSAIGSTVGTCLGTPVNTKQVPNGAASGPGIVSILPESLVGLDVVNTIILIDSLTSGVQESVSIGTVSYPTFSVALANAHSAGFKITDTRTSQAVATQLISTPGSGLTYASLVAAYVNNQA